jgi:hypothetical protein
MEDQGASDDDRPAVSRRADPGADPDREAGNGFRNWIAFLFVVILAAAAIYVANALIKQVKLQDCVISGRKDCVEIGPSSTR